MGCLIISAVTLRAPVSSSPAQPSSILLRQVTFQSLADALFLVGAGALFRLRYRRTFLRSVGFEIPDRRLRPAIVLGLVMAVVVVLVRAVANRGASKEAFGVAVGSSALWPVAVVGITLFPVVEEAFFRGVLQPLVVRSLGVSLGIALPALLYGTFLLPQYGLTWQSGSLAVVSGTWGWIRYRTCSTTAAAAAHAAYNGTTFLLMLLFHTAPA
jgi:membrane protease YdiL (CAAX protease family)